MMKYQKLTECELLVMKCIWDAGSEIRVAEIVTELRNRGIDYKRTTVATYLMHLKEKGFVKVSREDKNVYYYLPEIPLEEFRRARTREYFDFWYQGDQKNFAEDMGMKLV